MGESDRDGLFEGIFATAIDGIIAIDAQGTIESFNPAAEKLFGYAAEEAVGRNVRMLMPSPDRESHDGYLHNYLSTGKRKIIGSGREVTALHKSGTPIPIHLSLSEAQVGERRVFVGICRDIRELVRARGEVEAVRRRNDAVLDTAADGILTINAQGVVQSFNAAAEKLFGYSKSEVVGENIRRLMPRSIGEHHDGYLAHTLRTGERKIIGIGREVTGLRKDGSTFPAWLSVSQFQIEEVDYFTGILRDVSELRQREDELRQLNLELEESGWLAARRLELNDVTRASSSLNEACQALVDIVVEQTGALSAVGYLTQWPHYDVLCPIASYATPADRNQQQTLKLGEGLLGQAARTRQMQLVNVESFDYSIASAFGRIRPTHLALLPLVHNDALVGAFEIAFGAQPSARAQRYLRTLPEGCAVLLGAIRDQERIQSLLGQSQTQTEELQLVNEQLDHRAQELLAQQEQLGTTNEQLAEQKTRLELANDDLTRSRAEVEEKAAALEKTGRYKSEFLANMSHELRTPLNSILVLAKVLLENRDNNLSLDQLESLQVVAGSGEDLLNLINDILDVSKMEAGKLRFHPAEVSLARLLEDVRRTFDPLMNAKGLQFTCSEQGTLPATIYTDSMRLEQVLRNLLSNANKFTVKGSVTMTVSRLGVQDSWKRTSLEPGRALVFRLSDTGLGIPLDKQELVFQAFQQADTTLSRKFGGTGLGLSISTSLAEQLGGEIQLQSEEGVGSTFTLLIPERYDFPDLPSGRRASNDVPPGDNEATADGASPLWGNGNAPQILLIEDDRASQVAITKLLESRGMKVQAVTSARAGLAGLQERTYDCVVLDLMLGAQTGFEFLAALTTIPGSMPPIVVHTGKDLPPDEVAALQADTRAIVVKGERAGRRLLDEVQLVLQRPAVPPSQATVSRDPVFHQTRVLVVDDDVRNVFALRALLAGTGMVVVAAETGLEAITSYASDPRFDCVLMDIMMPEMDGYEAIRRIRALPSGADVPIIALTAKAMSGDRQLCIDAGANDYMSKPIDSDQLLGMMRSWMTLQPPSN